MLLGTVKNCVVIKGRGLVVSADIAGKRAKPGDTIRITRPDGKVITTQIAGISFEDMAVMIRGNFSEKDVPAGSEMWLNNA